MSQVCDFKVAIIGGCGHVGLPLGVKFALAGADTNLVDIDRTGVDKVNQGIFPHLELGGSEQLTKALARKLLRATTEPKTCCEADFVVFVTGTPVDEHLNPRVRDVLEIIDQYLPFMSPSACAVMRSTLFPGTMQHLRNRIARSSNPVKLAFCPERVAQGFALQEIDSLPQIISAFDEDSFQAAYRAFRLLAPEIIRLTPLEAEITKLMANSWRYLEFAIANQFYMIAEENGVDFYRIYQAIRHNYPRAKEYKSPGFAAGPCLFKDTMQLASYFDHKFHLGHSAMLVNEGLATLVVKKCSDRLGGTLWGNKVGILGMAFKANNDDIRESLSFRVRKGLEFHGAQTFYNDPYLADSVDLAQLEEMCDLFVLCTPHREYQYFTSDKPIIDIWGFFQKSHLEILPGTIANDQLEGSHLGRMWSGSSFPGT